MMHTHTASSAYINSIYFISKFFYLFGLVFAHTAIRAVIKISFSSFSAFASGCFITTIFAFIHWISRTQIIGGRLYFFFLLLLFAYGILSVLPFRLVPRYLCSVLHCVFVLFKGRRKTPCFAFARHKQDPSLPGREGGWRKYRENT